MGDLDARLKSGPHLGHLLAGALGANRDRGVLEIDGRTMTGGDLAAEISRYAAAFVNHGVVTGSPLGMLALNRPEVLVVIGAGQTQGYRRTALHPLGSLDDHAYVLADAGIETLVVDNQPHLLERAAQLLERVDCLTQVLTLGPCPEDSTQFGTDLVAAAASYPASALEVADLPGDAIVSVTYTGGTTGRPKGVVGTAASMSAMTQVQLAEWEWPDAPRFLMCTPLSHAGAAFFAPVVMKGGALVVLPKFDPELVARTIQQERITATMLVPSMLYALMDHPATASYDLSSLETVYYGASAINPVRLAEAIERFGPVFAQYYGQSEAPMVISYLARRDHTPERLSSCGRPSAWLRSALLDEDGKPVAPGEPGEICVAGPVLANGYWHNEEATAEAFRDGWLRTGDVARADEDGFWYIVDRTKDMIVTGGFNVFPREVEDVIATHPAVAQVAVIGTPDEKFGEAVTALVVLRDGASLTDELVAEITAAVKAKKGSVQAPKQVLAVDAVPLTGLGKPDKKALRAEFWKDAGRSVG
jgi:fatty-acyl-CoA synthase